MTYKIVQMHNVVNNETNENEGVEKQQMSTKLALAELTEGITPIVYAIGFFMAYYGSNGHILGNVKNDYWDYKKVEEVGYLFQMMILLFGVDTLSVFVNFVILSTRTNINIFTESCRILKKYWYFIAIKYAENMCLMFLTKDINLGMDSTGDFNWITNDGKISLINGSSYLSYEEKTMLINQTIW